MYVWIVEKDVNAESWTSAGLWVTLAVCSSEEIAISFVPQWDRPRLKDSGTLSTPYHRINKHVVMETDNV